MAFFKVADLSIFKGMVVEASMTSIRDPNWGWPLHEVTRLIDRDRIVGDRGVSYPVEKETLFIRSSALIEIDDPGTRAYASDNPWGATLFEGRYVKGNIEVAYARYEHATQVTVIEKQENLKTLFTGYFDDFDRVQVIIEDHLEHNDDVDDLIFELAAVAGVR